jgi:hypothetical protein
MRAMKFEFADVQGVGSSFENLRTSGEMKR